jgi:predicted aldo/keto reductase-like oxidoreductase
MSDNNERNSSLDRRIFLKTVGVAGMSSLFATAAHAGENQEVPTVAGKKGQGTLPHIPKRKLGKTGVEVACLSHGLMYNLLEKQIVLHKGLAWGVSQWDTANSYANGNSELGVGKFLKRQPEARKNIFLVTKASRSNTIEDVEERLQTSLKRMSTSYVDLYYGVHGLYNPSQLTDELRDWAKSAKDRGLIRHFGFSTHKNMHKCLTKAADLDWIDVIMTSYNFRLMQDKKLNRAVDACHEAGIGLIAMKTQGKEIKSRKDRKLTQHFLESGFTEGQAKLKVVMDDKRFAATCITMQSVALLTTNVAAVLDKTKLSGVDKSVLAEFAEQTCSGYCAGCGYLCDRTVAGAPYVSDVMRYLMYCNSYGDEQKARELFSEIPVAAREKLAKADFSVAERRCPQGLPIGAFVKEAIDKLS